MNETVNDGVDWLAGLGSIGVFLLALIANASIIIQIPYTLPAPVGGARWRRPSCSMLILGVAFGPRRRDRRDPRLQGRRRTRGRSNAQPDGRVFRWIARNVDARPRLTSFVIFLHRAVPAARRHGRDAARA